MMFPDVLCFSSPDRPEVLFLSFFSLPSAAVPKHFVTPLPRTYPGSHTGKVHKLPILRSVPDDPVVEATLPEVPESPVPVFSPLPEDSKKRDNS